MNTLLLLTLSVIAVSVISITDTISMDTTIQEISTSKPQYITDRQLPIRDIDTSVYKDMSTSYLQQEVERLSQNDALPFPMGIELIKRWTETK